MRTLLTHSGPEDGPLVMQAGVCNGGPGVTGVIGLYSPPVTLGTRPSELTRTWTGLETVRELCDMLNSLVRKVRMRQAALPRWWLCLCWGDTSQVAFRRAAEWHCLAAYTSALWEVISSSSWMGTWVRKGLWLFDSLLASSVTRMVLSLQSTLSGNLLND